MISKEIRRFTVRVAFFSVFLILGLLSLRAIANVPPVDNPQQPADSTASGEPQTSKATSQQWHTYLWESIPTEWLQDSSKAPLLQAYQENDWKPFFITGRFELNPNGRLLIQQLEAAQNDALEPRSYRVEALQQALGKLETLRLSLQTAEPGYRDDLADGQDFSSQPRQTQEEPGPGTTSSTDSNRTPIPGADQAREKAKDTYRLYQDLFRLSSTVDVQLAGILLRFTNDMNPYAKEFQFKALLGQYPMAQFLQELEPPPQYHVLMQAFQHYRQLAAQYPQVRLVQAQKLGPGDNGAPVQDLQQRLMQENFYHGKITGHFDETTRQAVLQFQVFHNLEADGKVGQQTREWLNVSFQTKADLIAQALKLYRQSQTRRFQKFVWVNIPQFTLEYRNGGKIEAVHRVIVGKASGKKIKLNGRVVGENQTPTLASSIEQVVINPRWYVTDRIRLELADAIAADPSYLARNGYVELPSGRGESRLIQLPGPNNALGRVRFDFPNAYAVYMHDTPNRGLFQRSRRDFSHGCIRVDKAHELARELLEADQNPAASKTEAFLATNRETFLKLNEPIPIVIEYLPVVVNNKGELVFCGDPYGWFMGSSDRKS